MPGKGKGKGKGRKRKAKKEEFPPTEADLVPMWKRIEALNLTRIPGPLVPDHEATPMHKAATDGDVNTIKYLLENGATVDIVDAVGSTPLLYACAYAQVPMVHFLVEMGANINYQNDFGIAPIHLTVLRGEMTATKFFVDRGCDLNLVDKQGRNVLHICADRGSYKLAHLLSGVKEKEEKEAAQRAEEERRAAERAALEKEEAERAEREGTNPDDEGEKPRSKSRRRLEREQAEREAALKEQEELEKANARVWCNVEVQDQAGWTPLHHAAARGHSNLVSLLVDKCNVDRSKIDKRTGETALLKAVRQGYLSVVRMLRGAGVNTKDKTGFAPLQISIQESHTDIFRLLVDQGADVAVKTDRDWTLLHLAAYHGNISLVKWLVLVQGESFNSKTKDGEKPYALTRDIRVKKFLQERMLGDLQERPSPEAVSPPATSEGPREPSYPELPAGES